jgi:hypothetical protein
MPEADAIHTIITDANRLAHGRKLPGSESFLQSLPAWNQLTRL